MRVKVPISDVDKFTSRKEDENNNNSTLTILNIWQWKHNILYYEHINPHAICHHRCVITTYYKPIVQALKTVQDCSLVRSLLKYVSVTHTPYRASSKVVFAIHCLFAKNWTPPSRLRPSFSCAQSRLISWQTFQRKPIVLLHRLVRGSI